MECKLHSQPVATTYKMVTALCNMYTNELYQLPLQRYNLLRNDEFKLRAFIACSTTFLNTEIIILNIDMW